MFIYRGAAYILEQPTVCFVTTNRSFLFLLWYFKCNQVWSLKVHLVLLHFFSLNPYLKLLPCFFPKISMSNTKFQYEKMSRYCVTAKKHVQSINILENKQKYACLFCYTLSVYIWNETQINLLFQNDSLSLSNCL